MAPRENVAVQGDCKYLSDHAPRGKITQTVLFISRHINMIQPALTFLEMLVPFVIIQNLHFSVCFLNQCNVHLFLYLQKESPHCIPFPPP